MRLECPPIELSWKLPEILPYEQAKTSFEEEFGLRRSDSREPDPKQESSKCFQVSLSILLLLAAGLAALVLCREYLGDFLNWLSHLSGWHGPALFTVLFIFVSFPMMWGYIILNLGAGYLYGLFLGVLITSVGAGIGATVSFLICRRLWKDWVLSKLSTYENLKQIVRVIEGRQGFKIIMMTRLTPVPFGLQNALFSVAKIGKVRYISATVVGLLPTQILNTYMGTTLRSMEDVLAGKSSNTFVLISQVAIAIAVSYFVNQRMKREVHLACELEARVAQEEAIRKLNTALPIVATPTLPRTHSALNLRPDDTVINIPSASYMDLPALNHPEPTIYESVEDLHAPLLESNSSKENKLIRAHPQVVRGHRRALSTGSTRF